MKYHQLLITIFLSLLLQNYTWAEILSVPSTIEDGDPESAYYKNIDSSSYETSDTPEVDPPLFEDDTGPTLPDPGGDDSRFYEPGGIGHIPKDVEQDPGEFGYGPGGLGPERSKQKLDKLRQDMPGRTTIKNPGDTPVKKEVESLLKGLEADFYSATATLDKDYGYVTNLDLKSRAENSFTKSIGTPLERTNKFLNHYKPLFFSSGRTLKESTLSPIKYPSKSSKVSSVVKYQQMVNGIEAHGGRLYVHFNDDGIISISARTITIPDNLSLNPSIRKEEVKSIINNWALKKFGEPFRKQISQRVASPKLTLLNPSNIMDTDIETTLLAWEIKLGSHTVWMNAHTGEVLISYSNLRSAS